MADTGDVNPNINTDVRFRADDWDRAAMEHRHASKTARAAEGYERETHARLAEAAGRMEAAMVAHGWTCITIGPWVFVLHGPGSCERITDVVAVSTETRIR